MNSNEVAAIPGSTVYILVSKTEETLHSPVPFTTFDLASKAMADEFKERLDEVATALDEFISGEDDNIPDGIGLQVKSQWLGEDSAFITTDDDETMKWIITPCTVQGPSTEGDRRE